MSDVGPASLDEVYDVLSEKLGSLRQEPPRRRYGQVFVGSIEEARGRSLRRGSLARPGRRPVPAPRARRSVADRRAARASWRRASTRKATASLASACCFASAAAAAANRLAVFLPAHGRHAGATSRALFLRAGSDSRGGRTPAFAARIRKARRPGRSLAPGLAGPIRSRDRHRRCRVRSRFAPSRSQTPARAGQGRRALSGGNQRQPGALASDARPALAQSLDAGRRRGRSRIAATLAVLKQQRFARRSYSPSALQQFAACPYRFLLHAIFQLRPREASVPLEQMDPLTRGALFHAVQFELFRELSRARRFPSRPTAWPKRWTSPTRCSIASRPGSKTISRPPSRASGKAKWKICAPICAAGCSKSPQRSRSGFPCTSNSRSALRRTKIAILPAAPRKQ